MYEYARNCGHVPVLGNARCRFFCNSLINRGDFMRYRAGGGGGGAIAWLERATRASHALPVLAVYN